jgi:GWxTD domain-containing protein
MKKYFFYFFIFLLFTACGTSRKSASKSNTSQNKQNANTLHPQFVVYHANANTSELHFKIDSKELLYQRIDGVNFSSNVLISYRLLLTYDSKIIIDSSSARLVDINNDNIDKYLIGKLDFNTRAPSNYFLVVTIDDLNRNVSVSKTIAINKDNELNRQNFILKSVDTDVPLFRNYVNSTEQVAIHYKNKKSANIFVRYYNRDFPLAAPPFSDAAHNSFEYKEDSSFVLKLSENGVVNFIAKRKGFYHFQLDSSSHEGFTLFNFSESFPEIKKAEDMVAPVRYITSREEFDQISFNPNKKKAIENFWLSSTSSQDRARLAIKKYYNRVQECNRYFSSYIEGWKTDRGMIYLIFGSPNSIFRTENSETWLYGEENNVNAISFTFLKVNNPFTYNDFTLERSAFYKQIWFISVDSWRQGRAVLED